MPVRLVCARAVSDRAAAGPMAARAAARSAASSSTGSAASPPAARNAATTRSNESRRRSNCRSCTKIESCRVGCWALAGVANNTNPSKHTKKHSFRKPTSKPVSSVPIIRLDEQSNVFSWIRVTGWEVLFRRYRRGCPAAGRCIGCRKTPPGGDRVSPEERRGPPIGFARSARPACSGSGCGQARTGSNAVPRSCGCRRAIRCSRERPVQARRRRFARAEWSTRVCVGPSGVPVLPSSI